MNERRLDLFLHYLDHVIKICRSRSKRRSFVSANSLQSKLKITIILILGAMNTIFHKIL